MSGLKTGDRLAQAIQYRQEVNFGAVSYHVKGDEGDMFFAQSRFIKVAYLDEDLFKLYHRIVYSDRDATLARVNGILDSLGCHPSMRWVDPLRKDGGIWPTFAGRKVRRMGWVSTMVGLDPRTSSLLSTVEP